MLWDWGGLCDGVVAGCAFAVVLAVPAGGCAAAAGGDAAMTGAAHGSASTYRSSWYACRCDECRAAHTARQRREQAARVERLAADPAAAPHGRAKNGRAFPLSHYLPEAGR